MAVTIDGTNGLTFNNGSTQAGASPLALLAAVTPTAAANVDFLTTFTSAYNNYIITFNSVNAASGTSVQIYARFANAGVVDTTSVYGSSNPVSADVATTTAFFNIFAGYDSMNATTSRGASSVMQIMNVNATDSTFKGFFNQGLLNGGSASNANTFTTINSLGAYRNSAAVSGIRFYWSTGVNFAAQGRICVYGVANS